MENLQEDLTPKAVDNSANTTIDKKVYDDMEAAYKKQFEQLKAENERLTKQCNDYSTILTNLSMQKVEQKERNVNEIKKDLLGGIL